MEQANWFIIPIAAFVPLILGVIWYHPSVFGAKVASHHGETILKSKSPLQFLLIYVFSVIVAYVLTFMSVHQASVFQLFFMDPALDDPKSQYSTFINDFLATYGDRHRSFGHGVIHGAEAGLFWGLGMLGITTLMQAKPLRTIWIHLIFWIICSGIIGGLVCQYF